MSGESFQRARVRRSWTYYRAAEHMEGVGEQSIKNLERGLTDPAEVKLKTAVAILEAYWPDVQLADFLPNTRLKVAPKGRLSSVKEEPL
jgi:hypothetical protein